MSLLLDALQRASQDKAASAGAEPTAADFGLTPPPAASNPALRTTTTQPLRWPDAVTQTGNLGARPVTETRYQATAPYIAQGPDAAAAPGARMAQQLQRAQLSGSRPMWRPSTLVIAVVSLLTGVGLANWLWGSWQAQPVNTPVVAPNAVDTSKTSREGGNGLAAARIDVPLPPPALGPDALAPSPSSAARTATESPVLGERPLPAARTLPRTASTPIPNRMTSAGSTASAMALTVRPGARKPALTSEFKSRSSGANALETAYAALNAGRLDEAAKTYQEVLQQQPEQRDALLGLAYIAHRTGHRDEARAWYERVLRQEPDNPVAMTGLLSLDSRTELNQASSRAQDMAERHPDSAPALAALGTLLAKEGRMADARLAFDRAQTLEPANPAYAYNLAVSMDSLHQYDAAARQYERALVLAERLGQSHDAGFSRTVARQRLDQLRAAR